MGYKRVLYNTLIVLNLMRMKRYWEIAKPFFATAGLIGEWGATIRGWLGGGGREGMKKGGRQKKKKDKDKIENVKYTLRLPHLTKKNTTAPSRENRGPTRGAERGREEGGGGGERRKTPDRGDDAPRSSIYLLPRSAIRERVPPRPPVPRTGP